MCYVFVASAWTTYAVKERKNSLCLARRIYDIMMSYAALREVPGPFCPSGVPYRARCTYVYKHTGVSAFRPRRKEAAVTENRTRVLKQHIRSSATTARIQL